MLFVTFLRASALCLLVGSLVAGTALAAEQAKDKPPTTIPHPRTLLAHIPSELPGVEVHHTFPGISHPQQVVAGEEVTSLFTIRNGYNATIAVRWASGSIMSPQDARLKLDNFTVQGFHQTINEGQEQSFVYKFRTHESMPNRDFRVALTVFYDDLSTFLGHATTYFDGAVEVVEARHAIDFELLGLIGMSLAVVAVIVWAFWERISELPYVRDYLMKQKQQRKVAKAKAIAEERAAPSDRSDYLQGTPYAQLEKKRTQGGRKRR